MNSLTRLGLGQYGVSCWAALSAVAALACSEGSGQYGMQPAGPMRDGAAGSATEPEPGGDEGPTPVRGFVVREGAQLLLDGAPFRFAGTNNYYLMYVSRTMSDDVLETAAEAGFNTVRLWGSLDINSPAGSDSVRGPSNNTYFQYWDGSAPARNEGDNGLERLDYVIAKAGELGLRLVIPFVNNWNDFGGMDQYVQWRERSEPGSGPWFHDNFYTDETVRGWYKDWISYLVNRVNTVNGLAYKDDPTIVTWELANEPRCTGGGLYETSGTCTTDTLGAWVEEMSAHVKSADPKHLVAVGDEGFFCVPDGTHWTEQCGEGVDTVAFTALPNIDLMSYHLYPDSWGTDAAWGDEWILRHVEAAGSVGKPSLLGEFGLTDQSQRNRVYHRWLEALTNAGGEGALYWILSGINDDGSLYGDFDGFTIYGDTPTFQTLRNSAAALTSGTSDFPPVADHDRFFINRNTSGTFDFLSNDVAYGQEPGTLAVDLDLDTDGLQASLAFDGHALEANAGGFSFTPAPDFQGRLEQRYRVLDRLERSSNEARLLIIVTGDPIQLSSFEDGLGGFAPQNPENTALLTQSAAFASDGGFGLQIVSENGGWYGVTPAQPLDISARRAVSYDLRTADAGTVRAVRFFDGELRCTSGFDQVPAGSTLNVEIDITSMNCDPGFNMTSADAMFLRFGGGTFQFDNVVLK